MYKILHHSIRQKFKILRIVLLQHLGQKQNLQHRPLSTSILKLLVLYHLLNADVTDSRNHTPGYLGTKRMHAARYSKRSTNLTEAGASCLTWGCTRQFPEVLYNLNNSVFLSSELESKLQCLKQLIQILI